MYAQGANWSRHQHLLDIRLKNLFKKQPQEVWSSGIVSEETAPLGSEIESCQGFLSIWPFKHFFWWKTRTAHKTDNYVIKISSCFSNKVCRVCWRTQTMYVGMSSNATHQDTRQWDTLNGILEINRRCLLRCIFVYCIWSSTWSWPGLPDFSR
jgi:hypothetical protein